MKAELALCHRPKTEEKQDADYLEAMMLENKLNDQYQQLDLSYEQRKIISQWTNAIQAQKSAYMAVVFRWACSSVFLY